MRIWRGVALSLLLFMSSSAWSGNDIPVEAQKILDAANFPIYPGAVYCIGDAQSGIRLATDDDLETVKQWYRDKLPDWSLMTDWGLWVLHDGGPIKSGADLMSDSLTSISIGEQPMIPGWYGLDEDMTTEILLKVPVASGK